MKNRRWLIAVGIGIAGCSLSLAGRRTPAIADEGAAESVPQSTPADADAVKHFETRIAPLLTRHCLECHGGNSTKGRLDLTREAAAFAGGDSGSPIVPGQVADSLLWEYVEADEMPENRPPLSAREKEALRQWIEAGAIWPDDAVLGDTAEEPVASHWLRRLTVTEYIETVRRAVGVDVEQQAREILPRDVRADGFSNTAYNLSVDLEHVEGYARLAESIAGRMDVAAFVAEHSACQQLSAECMPEAIEGIGKWLLRGPLVEHEIDAFLSVSTAVLEEGGDSSEAVRYVIEAMLQSPRFLYRIEKQRGDAGQRRASDYELASRLSYILWGGPPDKELMRAAAAGELSEEAGVAQQVRRMLDDPRAVEKSSQFIHEWLNLDQLTYLRPNQDRFPRWHAGLAADMREETLAFFQEIVWEQNRPLWDLMNAQVTFVTPRLADHYGLPRRDAAAEAGGREFARYDLAAVPARGGLLTQGSVLTIGGDEASMVTRGLFVLKDLLYSQVGDPPPCLDTTPVPTKPGLSQRAIAMDRVTSAACGGCHAKIEPLAFGLEKFDGLGSYQEMDEHGNQLRDDGEIQFPNREEPVSYQSAAELMDLLAASDRVRMNITRKLTQFALGRPLVESDSPILDEIHQSAEAGGGTYASLITSIVMSDLVQMTSLETD